MSVDSNLLARVEDYRPRAGDPKKYTDNPCKICGWNEEMEIHKNPRLHGKGPYHYFAIKEIDK